MNDTNDDAITSLARIATASIRWMEKMRIARAVYDPDEELDHIQANLDRIARQLKAARPPMNETCYLCDGSKPLVPPADANVGLCQRHWNRWIALFTAPLNPAPPCAAHLIVEVTDDAHS